MTVTIDARATTHTSPHVSPQMREVAAPPAGPTIGIVAIGRNEGPRLRLCLQSALAASKAVVYVDSGSTDGSVQLARDMGASVVELDLSTPFTAARARNEGFAQLMKLAPDCEFVQFVDGDCEIVPGWLDTAAAALSANEKLAVVCGRRRERYPETSLYNKLCDIEWNTPVGPANSCGGDAIFRINAFREVGGFNATVIAGEEPELCFRLREKGWKIQRLDHEMTLHDAAMTRFGQWWKRNVRAGHAAAQGAHMHGKSPERFNVRSVWSNWIWGLMIPLGVIIAAGFTKGIGLLLLAMYPLQGARIKARARRIGMESRTARNYAIFIVLGKFPQMLGQVQFALSRLLGRKPKIIEYKTPAAAPSNA